MEERYVQVASGSKDAMHYIASKLRENGLDPVCAELTVPSWAYSGAEVNLEYWGLFVFTAASLRELADLCSECIILHGKWAEALRS